MMRSAMSFVVCLSLPLSICAQSEVTGSSTQATATTPVAYVYVANMPANNGQNQVLAYVADSTGRLMVIPGSPFAENVSDLAVNGKYLMGVSNSNTNINAYRIGNNGAIKFAVATDYEKAAGQSTLAGAETLFFDHSGSSLYVEGYNFITDNNGIYSFRVDKQTGALEYLGDNELGNFSFFPSIQATFTGGNVYAYLASGGCMYNQSFGFWRDTNGDLHDFGLSNTNGNVIRNFPTPPAGTTAYEPALGAADTTNHVAFILQPANPPGCSTLPPQIASYTTDKWGFLVTTNTAASMPTTLVHNAYVMQMAPGGKLLSVAGMEGLQVFHFNGAAAPTAYTGLLTTDEISQVFWDNSNHLYAISMTGNRLHVFTITPTSHAEAPGSPYTIKTPEFLIVQPLPL